MSVSGPFLETDRMSTQYKDIGNCLLSHRLVSRWNLLDYVTVNAKKVNSFKSRLGKERIKKMGLGLFLRLFAD